ncbi:MAG: response regulator [Bacteroidales bacterium]
MDINSTIIDTIDWRGKVILVAEDEVYNYKLIEKTLRKTGAKIIWAENGMEVVKMCEDPNNKIDLVLMDIKMPMMNGFEASERIKQIRANLPIIAQTAYALLFQVKTNEGKFDGYLTKPMRPSTLIALLSKFIKNEN